MKLILTQEVTGLGAAGDVVEVKDGYGRNFLIPQGSAIRWTRGGEKTIESIKKARSARAVRDADHAAEVKGKLEGPTFNVKVRAGQGGRLFGAVTPADIAAAINEASGAELVDKRTIVVGTTIKSLGGHTVTRDTAFPGSPGKPPLHSGCILSEEGVSRVKSRRRVRAGASARTGDGCRSVSCRRRPGCGTGAAPARPARDAG
jgi:large subunit ribosomal protein L9